MPSPNPIQLDPIDFESIPDATPEQRAQAEACVTRHARGEDDLRELFLTVFGTEPPAPPEPPAPRKPYQRPSNYGGPNSARRPDTEYSCGTTRGYLRHRYHREPICDGCQEAHRQDMRDRRAAARAAAEVAA